MICSVYFHYQVIYQKIDWKNIKQLYDGIGNTFSYKLSLPNNNILRIKLECLNPNGNSHYSRFWIPYLYLCENFGVIKEGETEIVEISSGNSGIALSNACSALGYKLVLIVPEMLPDKRTSPIIENGANVIKVHGYIDECIDYLQHYIKGKDVFASNHSEEKANIITYVFSRIAYEHIDKYGVPDYAIVGLGKWKQHRSGWKSF